MKTWKKTAVLLLVFIAAAVIYFLWPMWKKEDHGTVAYTAMEEAVLPVVYPRQGEREMAPLFGQTEEKAAAASRDSLLVLPEDRALPVRISGNQIRGLGYEVRSLDMDHLVERTELSGWQEADGEISVTLPIQNLLEAGTEYMLGLKAELTDGRTVWYYTRIVEADGSHAEEMFALAESFSQKTLSYEEAQGLTMYMESSPSADNSSFGTVTLKNSFTQMTWGGLSVERTGPVYMKLKELSGNLANIQLDYHVTREEQGKTELYEVSENFTMRWAAQRIYMMDYERTMDQLFTGSPELYAGKRILLGIGSGDGLYGKKSAGGQYTAFVVNRELWLYDSAGNQSVRVFSFGGTELEDPRNQVDRHGVDILEIGDTGELDFLVYGRMNRGPHEGSTGVSYYHYDLEDNTLSEEFFLPAAESFEELKEDVETLAHKGANGIFYLSMGQAIYGIDLKSREYVVVASGLTGDKFAVSEDHSRIAWQENTGVYDSKLLHIMDLDTGDKTQLGGADGEVCRIIGFVGNDCIYGKGSEGDYVMSNGRIMGLYLGSLEIVDKNMETVMHYEKNGYYIREVSVDDSRIHIKRVQDRTAGFFGAGSEDTLVCNSESLPGKMEAIGWYASDVKERVYFVQLTRDAGSSQTMKTLVPRMAASQEVISLTAPAETETLEFCAYGRGRFLGRFVRFADAAAAAYDCMGFVTVRKGEIIWERANRTNAGYVRDLQTSSRWLERYRSEFTGTARTEDGGLLLDASGASLTQILYFAGRNIPVLVYTGEGTFVYVTGYDPGHVRVQDPAEGTVENMTVESARTYFEASGNDYICYIPAP